MSGVWRIGIATLAACALAAPASAAATSQRGAHDLRFGFNEDLRPWAAHVPEAAALGAETGRIPVGYDGISDPAELDHLYEQFRDHRIKPILNVTGPTHAMPAVADFSAAAAAYATRYPRAEIQLLNEPNISFWRALKPKEVARYVRAATAAIRQASPRTRVIGPSAAPINSYESYLRAVYRRLPNSVEPAVHIYPAGKRWRQVASKIRSAYRLLARFGPVHVTEIGMRAEYFRHRQAAFSARAYRLLERLGARTVLFHRLVPASGAWEAAGSLSVIDDPDLARKLKRAAR